jgi:hypothetical protein
MMIAAAAERVAVEKYRAGDHEGARAGFIIARKAGHFAPPLLAHADRYGVVHVAETRIAARACAAEMNRTY